MRIRRLICGNYHFATNDERRRTEGKLYNEWRLVTGEVLVKLIERKLELEDA